MSSGSSFLLFNKNLNNFISAVEELFKALGSPAYKIKAPSTWTRNNENQDILQLPTIICLERIIQKPGGGGRKTMNAYISGTITLSNEEQNKISFFGTKILYCLNKSQADLLNLDATSGFHFDLSTDCPIHPTFHMQADRTILMEELRQKTPGLTINTYEDVKENKDARIPTTQMDVFSAIIMVIADHCINQNDGAQIEAFKNFLSKAKSYIPEIASNYHPSIPHNASEIDEWYKSV